LNRPTACRSAPPQRVATTVHACTRCGQDLLLLIFGDQARDAEGLLGYGRLMHEALVARGLPAYVLGAPEGDGMRDDTPSLLLQVWPTPGEVRRVTPGEWDGLLEQWSHAHCARTQPPTVPPGARGSFPDLPV